jgi:hypothetical protein
MIKSFEIFKATDEMDAPNYDVNAPNQLSQLNNMTRVIHWEIYGKYFEAKVG